MVVRAVEDESQWRGGLPAFVRAVEMRAYVRVTSSSLLIAVAFGQKPRIHPGLDSNSEIWGLVYRISLSLILAKGPNLVIE